MRRIQILDGMRGCLLILMLLNHLTFSGTFTLGWLNYSRISFVESAQGFIFVSGLLVGLVYMRIYERGGPMAAARRLGRRALELYGWHLALVLIVLLLSRLMVDSWAAWGDWLGQLYEDGTGYAIAAAGLLYQPTFMDILPQYIVYLLVSPAVLWLVATGRLWLVAALSICAWLVAQFGAQLPLVDAVEARLWYGETDLIIRAHFNPLAWQIVFVPGVAIGALLARGDWDPRRLFAAGRTDWLKLALGILAFFALWRLAFHLDWVGSPVLERFQGLERRNEFGPVFLICFVAAAYAVTWLLMAGAESRSLVATRLVAWLRALMGHPFIMLLGRHALPVYAFHVLLVYALRLTEVGLGGLGDPWSSLLGLAAIAALALPALAMERWRAARTPAPSTAG